MASTAAKLRLLLRAEVLRGRIAARSLAVRASFYAVAALFAVLGLVMLVAAAYLALSDWLGPVYGALATGAGLGLCALLLFSIAAPVSRGRDAALADELEAAIRAELMRDLHAVEAQVKAFDGGLAGLAGLGRGPLGLLAFAVGIAAALSPRLRALLSGLLR